MFIRREFGRNGYWVPPTRWNRYTRREFGRDRYWLPPTQWDKFLTFTRREFGRDGYWLILNIACVVGARYATTKIKFYLGSNPEKIEICSFSTLFNYYVSLHPDDDDDL